MSLARADSRAIERRRSEGPKRLSKSDRVRHERYARRSSTSPMQRSLLEDSMRAVFVKAADMPPDVVTMNTPFNGRAPVEAAFSVDIGLFG